MLKLNAKCWTSTYNAQGLRGIIVLIHVEIVKIYVKIVEVLRKTKTRWNSGNHQKWWFFEFHPCWMFFFFFQFFFNFTLCMTKLEVLTLSFSDFTYISITLYFFNSTGIECLNRQSLPYFCVEFVDIVLPWYLVVFTQITLFKLKCWNFQNIFFQTIAFHEGKQYLFEIFKFLLWNLQN